MDFICRCKTLPTASELAKYLEERMGPDERMAKLNAGGDRFMVVIRSNGTIEVRSEFGCPLNPVSQKMVAALVVQFRQEKLQPAPSPTAASVRAAA